MGDGGLFWEKLKADVMYFRSERFLYLTLGELSRS